MSALDPMKLYTIASQLSRNQNIKICQFDKGNDAAVLNSECYFKKLDSIVNGSNKFKELHFNFHSNAFEDSKSAP